MLSRLGEIGNESYVFVQDAVATKENYGYSSKIIAGSMNPQNNIIACQSAGLDIVTNPPALFSQLFKHNLTESRLF